MRKIMMVLLTAILSMYMVEAAAEKYEYALQEDGTAVIIGYRGEKEQIIIPSEIDGKRVTAIGDNAFLMHQEITRVTIPDGVERIGFLAFALTSLSSIEFPDGVVEIGDNAFQSVSTLSSVSFPDGLKSIGNRAFYECSALTEIVIPDGVKKIDGSAFEWCTNLAGVLIPKSVEHIGINAFANCSDDLLVVVYEGSYAETYCNENGLSYVCIKSKESDVEVVENGNVSLEEGQYLEGDYVYIVTENGYVQIVDYVGTAAELSIPEELNDHKVSSIGNFAFEECDSLVSIRIPNSVSDIGGYAFQQCSSLKNVSMPGGVSIGSGAFHDCDQLTGITLPERVFVFTNPFSDCDGLVDIQLEPQDDLSVIDNVLFCNVTNWNGEDGKMLVCYPKGMKRKCYKIPDGTSLIGMDAFYGCDFEEVFIPDTVREVLSDAFANCKSLKSITIPNGCVLYDEAFGACTSLENVELPVGLEVIEKESFRGCISLREIEIPDSVTTICDGAFLDCSSLREIRIPDSVTSIGFNSFSGCDNLTVVVSRGSYAESYCQENLLSYEYIE